MIYCVRIENTRIKAGDDLIFFTKKLYDSQQFFHWFIDNYTFDQYLDYWYGGLTVDCLPESLYARHKSQIESLKQSDGKNDIPIKMLNLSWDEYLEWADIRFIMHVNAFLKENIYFYDEVREIIYDCSGHIRRFDEHIYVQLKYYAVKSNIINIEATIAVMENRNNIFSGPYSDGLKALTNAGDMHEAKVRFKIRPPFIIAYFGQALYHSSMICRFRADFSGGLDFTEDDEFEIIDSEVLINTDSSFQYNALVYGRVDELTINFYDVEVEMIELGDGD